MRKDRTMLLLILLCATVQGAWAWDGSGTSTDPYQIKTSADWKQLADDVAGGNSYSGKYIKQMSDFEVAQAIGATDRSFSGHYDGNGHTLACQLIAGNETVAPFYQVDGAEINNLHVTGIIRGGIHTAGLVAFSVGNGRLTIENCRVSAAITCTGNDTDNAHGGGFIGHAGESEYAVTGCLFDGTITALSNGSGVKHVGAIVGWGGGGTRIVHTTIEKGTYEGVDKSQIAFCWQNNNNNTLTTYGGNYYLSDLGHGDGAEPLFSVKSGTEGMELQFSNDTWEDAYLGGLSKSKSQQHYMIDGIFYTPSAYSVSFKLTYPSAWKVTGVYANGAAITAGDNGLYTITNITANTSITITHDITYWTDEGNYSTSFSHVEGSDIYIESEAELALIAHNVNTGVTDYLDKHFILSRDLDLSGNEWTPIGTEEHPFRGNFDGNGKVISNMYVHKSDRGSYNGLFGYVCGLIWHLSPEKDEGGSDYIKNIIVKNAEIFGGNYTGSIIGRGYGRINAENLISEGCSVFGLENTGGVIGSCEGNYEQLGPGAIVYTEPELSNCFFLNGKLMEATSTKEPFPVVGWANWQTHSSNCYFSQVDHPVENEYNTQTYPLTTAPVNLGKQVKDFGNVEGYGIVKTYENGILLGGTYYVTPISLSDNGNNDSAISNADHGQANIRLAGRTLYRDGSWNTLCLPFDVTISGSVLNGATVKTLETSSFGSGTLTLNFADATSIEAGKPYLVKWALSGENISNPVFTDVTVNNTYEAAPTDYVNFEGSFSPVSLTGGDTSVLYLGADNKLYYPSADRTVGSCRAVFKLNGITAGDPSQSSTGVRSFVLNFGDDETTGIIGIGLTRIDTDKDDAWYDLQGRKLNGKPTHMGIYINNGKKVVIK